MRTNVIFSEIVNQVYNIFSDDRRAESYTSDRGELYDMFGGWAGPMSPANRAAFVQTFGRDVTDRAETEARARMDEYRAAVAASAYHRHELEADTFAASYGDPEKSQIPEVGAFVWGRWYMIDGQGYEYSRYFLMPEDFRQMYAPELATITAAREQREADERAEEQRQADARRADYLKRCARWAPLMEDVRPLMEADRAAYGSREKSQIRKASAKLAAARRRNLAAMASALYPGIKFSVKKWDGWGGSYELTWTDGPTEEHLKEAADFDLFESGRDTFDGMTDCAGVESAEFVDFANKYLGLFGQIRMNRHESDEFRQSIRDRIRAAVPGLPEGDQEPIRGGLSAICGMFPDVRASYIVQNLERYGLREAVAYIARCIDATPTQQDEPTDPNGGGSPAPTYGDSEKSQNPATVEGVEVVGYSEKALAVFGETRALADELKAIGAKFNRGLTYNGERRTGWIISRRKADELAALLGAPSNFPKGESCEADGAATPALPGPPAAVLYDPAQPIDRTEFVAVDADGAPYGEGEKSQNPEAVEVSGCPDVKEYRLMYLFGAWVGHSRVYAETDAEAIEDATDDYLTSTLPRWPYSVALFDGSRLVHEFKGDGPDDIGRRDKEQEESENATAYIVHDTTAGPFAFEDYATGSILAAVAYIQKNSDVDNSHPLELIADGVKVWDSEDNPVELAYIVRQRLAVSSRLMDEEGTPSDSPKGESCDADGAAYGNPIKSQK